jgi:hypothetical protein
MAYDPFFSPGAHHFDRAADGGGDANVHDLPAGLLGPVKILAAKPPN